MKWFDMIKCDFLEFSLRIRCLMSKYFKIVIIVLQYLSIQFDFIPLIQIPLFQIPFYWMNPIQWCQWHSMRNRGSLYQIRRTMEWSGEKWNGEKKIQRRSKVWIQVERYEKKLKWPEKRIIYKRIKNCVGVVVEVEVEVEYGRKRNRLWNSGSYG